MSSILWCKYQKSFPISLLPKNDNQVVFNVTKWLKTFGKAAKTKCCTTDLPSKSQKNLFLERRQFTQWHHYRIEYSASRPKWSMIFVHPSTDVHYFNQLALYQNDLIKQRFAFSRVWSYDHLQGPEGDFRGWRSEHKCCAPFNMSFIA